jgi:hypothetical protein
MVENSRVCSRLAHLSLEQDATGGKDREFARPSLERICNNTFAQNSLERVCDKDS